MVAFLAPGRAAHKVEGFISTERFRRSDRGKVLGCRMVVLGENQQQRAMEPWEELDIDESDLDSFIRRCNSNNSVIPGLAGVIEAAMLN
ncbi:hypothetical protein LR48_Vigan10g100800 [Vigna angularis]|uniref:Uncharacterized protein n=1 Tax=Phaseolus angularis TaxID=3914 RepID=A0A0L9VJ90_PHAAN|nr:hypothetical protein LR48_Vigan10g100800 [Vigna angularis]